MTFKPILGETIFIVDLKVDLHFVFKCHLKKIIRALFKLGGKGQEIPKIHYHHFNNTISENNAITRG